MPCRHISFDIRRGATQAPASWRSARSLRIFPLRGNAEKHIMQSSVAGAIDCDLHPPLPGVTALLPYLNDYWRDQLSNRHIDKLPFQLSSYPPTSPLSSRPDWRPAPGQKAGVEQVRAHVLDRLGLSYAICNPLHGAVALFNNDMAAVL